MKDNIKFMVVPVLLLAFACVPQPLRLPADLVWPVPPDLPRIQYIESIYGTDYFVSKWSHALVNFFAGAEPARHFLKPVGVAADRAGNIYISDAPGFIVVIDKIKKRVRMIADHGQARLGSPAGLAFSNKYNQVFAADPYRQRVIGIDPESGKMVREISGGLVKPVGVAVDDENDRLAVVDIKAHQVKIYSLKDNHPIVTLGKRGTGEGEFNFPIAAAFDRRGHLFVSDSMNFRVQEFDKDFAFVQIIGSVGINPGEFSRPKGIGVDSEGHIYVADAAFGNVQIFDSEYGDLLLSFGVGGYGPGEFWLPNGLYVDAKDRIYVVDQVNRRVQVFQYLNEERAREVFTERALRASQDNSE